MDYVDPVTGRTFDISPGEVWFRNHPGRFSTAPNPDKMREEWEEWVDYDKYVVDDNDDSSAEVEEFYDDPDNVVEVPEEDDFEFDFEEDSFAPPPVPGGDKTPGKGVTSVSTDALKTFGNNIEGLAPSLTKILRTLDEVDIRAGALPVSYQLVNRIQGEGEMVPVLKQFVNSLGDALLEVVHCSRTMASAYQSNEEFNAKIGKELGEFVRRLDGNINDLGGGTTEV